MPLNKRKYFVFLLIFSLPFLSGCIVWETEEVEISLNKNGSGNIEIIFGPIGSDKKERGEREKDFTCLLYDVIENNTVGSSDIKNAKGRLEEKEGNLFGYISGSFENLDAVNIVLSDGKLVYKPEIGARILRTNGTVLKDASGSAIISWDADADRIEWKAEKSEYPAEGSLIPEYKKYLKARNHFRNLYIRLKLENGRELLKQKNFKDSYNSFGDVLRIDPKNNAASEDIRKLHFVPYLNAVALIPLPQIDLHLGMTFDINDLKEDNFKAIKQEIEKLRANVESDKDEKIYFSCRLSGLLKIAGKTDDSNRYGKEALRIYEGIKHSAKLNPENRLCIGNLLRMRGERTEAIKTFKALAMDHPEFWPSYVEIFSEYLEQKTEEVIEWINRGDSSLRNYLRGASDISAQNAFEIFKYSVTRNIIADIINNNQGNPVEPLSYQMITLSVDKEPDSPVYRGALGYTQLYLLTLYMFQYLDTSIGEPGEAIAKALNALDKNKETADLLKKADENLNHAFGNIRGNHPLMLRNLAYLSFLKQDFKGAEASYIKAIELDPSQGEAYYSLAAFYKTFYSNGGRIDKGKAEKILKLFERKLKTNPTGKDRFLAGRLMFDAEDYAGAYKMFLQSVKEDDRYYPSAVGFLKAWMMIAPDEAGNIVKEADELLERDYEIKGKDELRFARAVAIGLSDSREDGMKELKNLLTCEDADFVSSVRKVMDIFSR